MPIEIDQGLATIAGNLATICKDCHRKRQRGSNPTMAPVKPTRSRDRHVCVT
ncbi:MAG: HNH endonuclease [Lacticaseibacillus paracasei]|uniref:HNH endonuclease n=1 Tax=Lactobacillaceae TaxID=33958 RepID=UPI00345D72AF